MPTKAEMALVLDQAQLGIDAQTARIAELVAKLAKAAETISWQDMIITEARETIRRTKEELE